MHTLSRTNIYLFIYFLENENTHKHVHKFIDSNVFFLFLDLHERKDSAKDFAAAYDSTETGESQ